MRLLSAPLLAAVLATLACNPPPGGAPAKKEKTGTVVATVAGQKVTVEDLQKKLEEQSPFVRARYAEAEKKKELLDGQVRFEVLAAEAKSRGFADDPEVEEAIKKIIVQRLTREEFDGRVQLKDVTDAELETYFNDHKGDYQKPEMVRASFVAITHVVGDADAKKTADVCFNTYGVKFPMFTTTPVRGTDAHPLFASLTKATGSAPSWNFNKYLIGRDGKALAHFGSLTSPGSGSFTKAIEAALAGR